MGGKVGNGRCGNWGQKVASWVSAASSGIYLTLDAHKGCLDEVLMTP